MQEHDDIPEVLVDLQYSLAKSYSSTPELRETWLEHMAAVHESQENYSEVCVTYVTWTLRACVQVCVTHTPPAITELAISRAFAILLNINETKMKKLEGCLSH